MGMWARIRVDGIQLVRDPPDPAGLLPVVDDWPKLSGQNVYTGDVEYEQQADKVVLHHLQAAPTAAQLAAAAAETARTAALATVAAQADPNVADPSVSAVLTALAVLTLDQT